MMISKAYNLIHRERPYTTQNRNGVLNMTKEMKAKIEALDKKIPAEKQNAVKELLLKHGLHVDYDITMHYNRDTVEDTARAVMSSGMAYLIVDGIRCAPYCNNFNELPSMIEYFRSDIWK